MVNDTLYVIDAGDGVTRRIVQAGYDFRKVGKIFITHAHDDHTAGLATLLTSEWEYQRAEPIDIYGSGVEALIKGAVDYLTPNAEIRWAEGKKRPMAEIFHGHDVGPGFVYRDPQRQGDGGRKHAFPFRAWGLLLTASISPTPTASRRRAGSSSSLAIPVRQRLSLTLAKGADLYFSEVFSPDDAIELFKSNGAWQAKTPLEREGFLRHIHEEHVTPGDVGKMAAKAGVKAVVMTHIGPSIDPNDDYQRYIDEAKNFFSGPIILTKDLMRF